VYWAKNAAADFSGRVEVVDLRTLHPIDEATILASVKKNSRCLVVTEEPVHNSFAQALAGLVAEKCFELLDAPVRVVGSENLPAIPLNATLEHTMIPNTDKVREAMRLLLNY
jgi:2-oxoisovalerate dehydrogenase E1 component